MKRFLEARGFAVKGEVGGCDLLGMREGEPPLVVVGELKLAFSLDLVLQGVDRLRVADEVWLAAPLSRRGRGREGDPRFRDLCRRLGIGLLGIGPGNQVDVLVDPAGGLRRDKRRRSRLVAEHRARRGDPSPGGSVGRPVMTAYRQRALACAAALVAAPARPRDLRGSAPDAYGILSRNPYGWFERVARGLYGLTEAGREALRRWPLEG